MYGFKLHGVCNSDGELEDIFFTPGNVHDNRALKELIVNLEGIFVCDAGYLLKQEELEKFFEEEKRLYIAMRRNMKRVMTKAQHEIFRRRSVIENVWNTLKERLNIAYSFARGVHALFRITYIVLAVICSEIYLISFKAMFWVKSSFHQPEIINSNIDLEIKYVYRHHCFLFCNRVLMKAKNRSERESVDRRLTSLCYNSI